MKDFSIHGKLLGAGCTLLLLGAIAPAQAGNSTPAAKKTPAKSSTAHTVSHKGKKSKKTSLRKRGQQKIDTQRAHQIQAALIREHYMTGEPSGVWDTSTQKAMERYQGDHGWQNKTIPDSRALIQLGLGPDDKHLLNPESAMTSQPGPPHAATTPAPASSSSSKPQP